MTPTTDKDPATLADELLPCPFCEGKAAHYASKKAVFDVEWTVHVYHCTKCQGRVQNTDRMTAQTIWNTRILSGHGGGTVEHVDYKASLPDDIRFMGWSVAVHNDYRLNGNPHTFWLFTKQDRAIKGEGETDEEALNLVRSQIYGTVMSSPNPAAGDGVREALEEIAKGVTSTGSHFTATALRSIAQAALASAPLPQVALSREQISEYIRRLKIALALADTTTPMQENLCEAWSALTMIRETIETLGPSGAVKVAEHLDGPTFMHEADALVAGIRVLASAPLSSPNPAAGDGVRDGEDWGDLPSAYIESRRITSAPLPQVAGEPVAWQWWTEDYGWLGIIVGTTERIAEYKAAGKKLRPLYAAPLPSGRDAIDPVTVEAETFAGAIYTAEHKGIRNCWKWEDDGLDHEHPTSRGRYRKIAKELLKAFSIRAFSQVPASTPATVGLKS